MQDRRLWHCAIGLVSLCWAWVGLEAAPAEPASPTPPPEVLASELLGRNPQLNGSSSQPSAQGPIYSAFWGDLQPAVAGGAPATAAAFVRTYGTLLGFPAGFDMTRDVVSSTTETPGEGQMLVVTPVAAGVSAGEGQVAFLFDEAGNLTAVNGRYENVQAAVPASIDAGRAVQSALDALARKYPQQHMSSDGTLEETLAMLPDGQWHRVFRVAIVIGDPPMERIVEVGGAGEVLRELAGGLGAVPDATVYYRYPAYRPTVRALPDLAPPSRSYGPWTLDGSYFQSVSSFPLKAEARSGHFNFPTCRAFNLGAGAMSDTCEGAGQWVPWAPFLEANVYSHLEQAMNRAVEWGIPEARALNGGRRMTFDVWSGGERIGGVDLTMDNAYFQLADWSLHFLWRVTEGFRHPAKDASVIFHEYAHSLHYLLNMAACRNPGGSFEQQNDVGAIQEGFADFFACILCDDPCFGKVFRPPALRCLDNTQKYTDPDFQAMAGRQGMEHEMSTVFSGLCWDIKRAIGSEEAIRLVILAVRASAAPLGYRNIISGLRAVAASRWKGRYKADVDRALAGRGLDPDTVSRIYCGAYLPGGPKPGVDPCWPVSGGKPTYQLPPSPPSPPGNPSPLPPGNANGPAAPRGP